MALEIERKFLINASLFFQQTKLTNSYFIEQGYLCNIDGTAVRIRVVDRGEHSTAMLCIKRRISDVVREEYEYDIPLDDGLKLISSIESTIIKRRFFVKGGWEVDQFRGHLEGLYIAEIEVKNEEKFKELILPDWIMKDVTHMMEYTNTNLIGKKFDNGNIIDI